MISGVNWRTKEDGEARKHESMWGGERPPGLGKVQHLKSGEAHFSKGLKLE